MRKELTRRNVSINDIAERVKELAIGSDYEYILSLKAAEDIACMTMQAIIDYYNIDTRNEDIDNIIRLMINIYFDEEEPSDEELENYETEDDEISNNDYEPTEENTIPFIKILKETSKDDDELSELKEFIESISILTIIDSMIGNNCHIISIPKIKVPKINIKNGI